ncbi:ABC transporter ATP-binding protein [Paracholeplasma manati]|uniref:ABC transporter ATP-binding protein n=1 Tax=Paracholeplasma manati TaxID=591373 RepID=UPI0024087CAD|nr:oligopeptide/dipeptide ABC transporter ATP-binding protein [Paracholeplasma manati]MDG0888722.1 ATP-binding cassette domain-containing protein [Paracholeplasma manati]
MSNQEKVLEVKNLTVSFKTPNGLVRAVRDISFDLYKGETLAIVGESGSGKSVTNRAIMGILAGNAIIDDGEINYRNQDLTKLSEANFHKIRGNEIGMIFQDPLSSLNPIMKIGKQITEAMLVNGNRVKNRFIDLFHNEYHDYLNLLTRIKLAKKDLKDKIYEINVDKEMTKADKREKIVAYKAKSKALLADLKSQVPDVKRRYLAAKATAKVQIKKEIVEVNQEKQKAVSNLNAEIAKKVSALKDAQGNEAQQKRINQEIRELRVELSNLNEAFKRRFKVTQKEAYERAIQIMREVNIPDPEKRFNQYPFQFSGGMRQRIVIAIALTANPKLLICDEPTTALDVTIQEQILNQIKDIKKERDLSVIFITHDLGVVANMADRVAVMYAGKIVEYGTADEIFYNPKHPYTWALLSSVPDLDTKDKLVSIPGTPPDMLFPPKGDAFAERNKYALKIDFEEQPPFFKVSDTHYAATWLLHPDAPKIPTPPIIQQRIERYTKTTAAKLAETETKTKTVEGE